jgi:hypothetical protein
MKKSVIIAALGMTVGAVSSFGQGAMTFNSYLANATAGVIVDFSAGLGGGPVATGYTADLLYSLSPITEAAGNGAISGGWTLASAVSPSVQSVTTPFGTTSTDSGYFQGPNNFVLTPYTAGTTVYFEVIAYQTANGYAASLDRGHSASFSTTLATGSNLPTDIGAAGMTPFLVSPVPEPTTLALAGLGGLASLVAFRRKQA